MKPESERFRYGDTRSESHQRAQQARDLRKLSSPPERRLWQNLRNRQLRGLKFRRQHPIGPYIADFYCEQLKLAVEVDGRIHELRQVEDARRDECFARLGVRVVRIPARLIVNDLDAALRLIAQIAREIDGELKP